MADQLSTDSGQNYLHGPSYSVYHPTPEAFPTWPKPADTFWPPYACANQGTGWYWQVGGPPSACGYNGDYSSNMGQATYVADSPTTNYGVSVLINLQQAYDTYVEKPQYPWLYGSSPTDPRIGPAVDPNLNDYNSAGLPAQYPIAVERCHGFEGWCVEDIIAFQSGLLATFGTNTSRGKVTLQLDPGKVPTAISVTDAGEFALVTVWDTVNLKGQVAVIALATSCPGCGLPIGGDWTALEPGLRNYGRYTFMKLLGYIDLPGMMAPTGISASSNLSPHLVNQGWLTCADGSGNCQPYQLPLDIETNRQTFITGGSGAHGGVNASAITRSGFAVVISKSEKKAIFIDLKPLFQGFHDQYFTSLSNFQLTQTIGLAANQWPLAFSYAPSFTPTIVKTVSFTDTPTAVAVAMSTVDRAWIATEDGTLHIWSVGGYGDNTASSPTQIAEVGSVPGVGNNPTSIAYIFHDWANAGGYGEGVINHEVIITSRGDRAINWVSFANDNNSGSITRTLRDSRLIDPIASEDNDNHGTESYLLSVADYGGKQVANYRYGNVIFWTNIGNSRGTGTGQACQPSAPCTILGGGQFEFGGRWMAPGKVFHFTSADVP
jgi:hypothetical protein